MVELDLSKMKCHWCGTPESFRCTCGYRTCSDCLLFPKEGSCLHKKYEPVESDGWKVEND